MSAQIGHFTRILQYDKMVNSEAFRYASNMGLKVTPHDVLGVVAATLGDGKYE